MIASAKEKNQDAVPEWHQGFLQLLPDIKRHALFALRELQPEAKDDALHEVIASAMVAYVRLSALGKTDVAYPSVLARFGAAQYHAGRRVGGKLNSKDVMSVHARMKHGLQIERLDRFDTRTGRWKEILVEDHHAGPADTAAIRIDFGDWMASLPNRDRDIADSLATGERTQTVARQFRVSPGRISQLRRELRRAWQLFQGELLEPSAV